MTNPYQTECDENTEGESCCDDCTPAWHQGQRYCMSCDTDLDCYVDGCDAKPTVDYWGIWICQACFNEAQTKRQD